MCIFTILSLVNTIHFHSFSQACLSFSFLSRKLYVIFLLARFSVTSFHETSHGIRALLLGESA
jgi:hypothetical protein